MTRYATKDCECPDIITGTGGKRPTEPCECGNRFQTEAELRSVGVGVEGGLVRTSPSLGVDSSAPRRRYKKRSEPKLRYGDMSPRPCVSCGQDFKPKRSFSKYCSKVCGRRGEQGERRCDWCGDAYNYWMGETLRRCCSRACGRKMAGRTKRDQAPPKVLPTCAQCGEAFESTRSEQKYCSRKCLGISVRRPKRKVTNAPSNWGCKAKGESDCRNCHRPASHLHHVVPRSKSREGAGNFDNGIPLCFECHRGWHDRRVVIPITCLRVPEMQAAVALTDAIWVERNYPIPSTQEQADLVRATGSIEMAYEAMPHYLGEHRETFMELTAEKRPPGETLELFLLAVSDCGSLEIARRRLAPSAYVESLAS